MRRRTLLLVTSLIAASLLVSDYAELFFDDFTFVFSPDDISQNPSFPGQWGLAEELGSARNMFRSESVDMIELGITMSPGASSRSIPRP